MTDQEQYEKAVKHFDAEDDDASKVVIASLIVGPNQRRIAKLTGIDREVIRVFGSRLREQKVWVGGRVAVEDPTKGPDGIELALLSGVAVGWLAAVDA